MLQTIRYQKRQKPEERKCYSWTNSAIGFNLASCGAHVLHDYSEPWFHKSNSTAHTENSVTLFSVEYESIICMQNYRGIHGDEQMKREALFFALWLQGPSHVVPTSQRWIARRYAATRLRDGTASSSRNSTQSADDSARQRLRAAGAPAGFAAAVALEHLARPCAFLATPACQNISFRCLGLQLTAGSGNNVRADTARTFPTVQRTLLRLPEIQNQCSNSHPNPCGEGP